MNRYAELKGRLKKLIPTLNNFLKTVSANEILIAEHEKDKTACILMHVDRITGTCLVKGETVTLDESKVFYIYNSPTVDFVPIDGNQGLLNGSSNCDFVFYNEVNFCFVELKLNATSMEERAIRKNRVKAANQLTNTIAYFDAILGKDYSGLNLEAYISTPDMYPRENTAFQSVKVKFLETTGIELFESREKRY